MTTPDLVGTSRVQPLGPVLADRSRPPRASALAACVAFGWRAFLKVKHVPEQLGDVIGIPIIFTLMFTYLFGGALAGSTSEYLRFILPGTLVMAVLLVTIYSGVGLNTDITTGVFDRIRSMPIWRPAPIVGALLGDIGRYLISAMLVIGLGLALGFRPAAGVRGVLGAIALVLVFAFALSWVWTSLALVVRTPGSVLNAGLMVLFPITFASNVFVDPETMPDWLQTVVDLNPVSHLVTAVRGLMQGAVSSSDVIWALVASAALTAVFAPLTVWLYGRKG